MAGLPSVAKGLAKASLHSVFAASAIALLGGVSDCKPWYYPRSCLGQSASADTAPGSFFRKEVFSASFSLGILYSFGSQPSPKVPRMALRRVSAHSSGPGYLHLCQSSRSIVLLTKREWTFAEVVELLR